MHRQVAGSIRLYRGGTRAAYNGVDEGPTWLLNDVDIDKGRLTARNADVGLH